MKHTLRLLSLLIVSSTLLAQEPAGPTPPKAQPASAEQLFRDAWWAESGANDTASALRGYLDAAGATGPSAVRARALLFAGRLQQRLGKQDVALNSFRRLVTEFATETELVNEARTHLRELTAVDLRQNYDEWYERRLFSEEVQLVILGKIEALGSRADLSFEDGKKQQEHRQQMQALIAEIEAFGKGAVPALRKVALGSHYAMANTAIEMLVHVGEMPPLRSLLTHTDWLDDSEMVAKLLTMTTKESMPELAANDRHGPWVAAVLGGPDALAVRILAAPQDGPAELGALVSAVLPTATARKRLVAAMQQPGMALFVREAIENAFVNHDSLSLGAAEWLAIGTDTLRAELRNVSISQAARSLRPADGDTLDRLLAAVEDRDAPSGHDAALVTVFARGLAENRAVEVLPWTRDRLVKLLRCVPACEDTALAQPLQQLRRADTSRPIVAEALFADPVAVCHGFGKDIDDAAVVERLGQNLATSLDDADLALLARRWHAAMVTVLTGKWAQYDDAARKAAVVVLQGAAMPAARSALVEFLRQQEAAASAELKPAIELARNNLGG